ncbi:MAG: hypothetical protein L6Q84_20000 [Polyangiaceae bacterium]|nr:hypothetical protein [Polyangiaceae bacterium]
MAPRIEQRPKPRAGGAPTDRVDEQRGVEPARAKPKPAVPPPLTDAERRLSEMFRLRPTVIERTKPAQRHPPLQDRGTEETIRTALSQQSGMSIRTKPEPGSIEFVAPRQPLPKPVIKPLSGAPQAPIPVRIEAERRIQALESKHAKMKSQVERAIDVHTKDAARLRSLAREDAKRGIFREGLEGAVWHSEHQATLAKQMLRDLEVEHRAARYAYDALVGTVSGPAMRQGDGRRVPPNEARSAAERFAERVERYNRSVETLRTSGPIAAVVATTVPLAAALNGKDSLDDEHLRVMDAIHSAGTVGNVPLGIKQTSDSRAKGAAPAAPGVDHRSEALNATRDANARANQSAHYGDR